MKRPLGIDVLTAARQRIAWIFDTFPKVCVSFSGGKDSSVMLHLAMDEARKRNQKIAVMFIDLEAQYRLTIEHVEQMYRDYKQWCDPYWVALPLALRNAVSQYEPQWMCWEPGREKDWVRKPPRTAITDESRFPFFTRGMEFEDFVEHFADWYSDGQLTAYLIGIRTDESLNRYRTLASDKKDCFEGRKWTTYMRRGTSYNAYPIYDWKTQDIWTYNGKFQACYNQLYDRMQKAGLSLHQQRICQPYGDDQRKGLWLFHLIEPQTWAKVVARVNGANQGALYARDTGNILGVNKITRPENCSWEEFAKRLLKSMPPQTRNHFENKISVFLHWWQDRGYPQGIPDEAEAKQEAAKAVPSWRRICKSLLRNDYWCKGLSFTQHKSGAYENYEKLMKKRRAKWNLI